MKKLIIIPLLLLCLTLGSLFVTALTPVKLITDITLDPRDVAREEIDVYLNEGSPKTFRMRDDEPKTYSLEFWYELDEDKYCEEFSKKIDEYKNITNSMSKMLYVCQNMVDEMNRTQKSVINYAKYKGEAEKWEETWKITEQLRKDSVNVSKTCQDNLNKITSQRDNYKSQIDRGIQSTTDDSCEEELSACEKSQITKLILGIIIGLGAYHFFLKDKNGGGPSEQSEIGYEGDSPRTRFPKKYDEPVK